MLMMGSKKIVSLSILMIVILAGCTDNNAGKQISNPDSNVDSLYRKKKEPDNSSHLACAIETCGTADKLPFENAPITSEDQAVYKIEFAPKINELIELNIQSIELRNSVIKKFSKMKIDSVSENYKAFLNFIYLQQFYMEIAENTKSLDAGDVINEEKLRKNLKEHLSSEDEISWVVKAAKILFESSTYVTAKRLSSMPLDFFVKYQYPNLDVLMATQAVGLHLKEIQKKLVAAIPLFKGSPYLKENLIEKAIRKEPLTTDEQEIFLSSRFTYIVLNELLQGGEWHEILLSRSFDVQQLANEAFEKALKAKDFQITRQSQEIKADVVKLQEQCSKKIAGALSSSPTIEQNEKFKSVIENAKRNALTVLQKSPYQSIEVVEAVEKTKFIMPQTKNEIKESVAKLFLEEVTSIRAKLQMLSDLKIDSDKDKEGVLLLVVNNYMYQDEYEDESEKEEEYILENVDMFCSANAANYISDAAYISFSTIIVGWRSVLYPDFGYSTLGHELGHIISYKDKEISSPKLKNLKSCLVENKAGSDQYIEEDFADLFEVQMLKNQTEIPAKNYSCFLLNQEKGQYRDLKLSDEVEDSHSTSFYRLIAIGSAMKNLSPMCQSVKDSSSEGKLWKDCWGL